MVDINIVINGDYKGKKVDTTFGDAVFISTSTFGQKAINNKTVEEFDVVKESKYNDDKMYTVSILFKSGKKSLLNVDKKIHKKLLNLWPEKKVNRLGQLLKEGYNIVGFSSYSFTDSGLGAGATSHNVLLQKGLNVEKISYITMGDTLNDAYSHIFHSE